MATNREAYSPRVPGWMEVGGFGKNLRDAFMMGEMARIIETNLDRLDVVEVINQAEGRLGIVGMKISDRVENYELWLKMDLLCGTMQSKMQLNSYVRAISGGVGRVGHRSELDNDLDGEDLLVSALIYAASKNQDQSGIGDIRKCFASGQGFGFSAFREEMWPTLKKLNKNSWGSFYNYGDEKILTVNASKEWWMVGMNDSDDRERLFLFRAPAICSPGSYDYGRYNNVEVDAVDIIFDPKRGLVTMVKGANWPIGQIFGVVEKWGKKERILTTVSAEVGIESARYITSELRPIDWYL